VHFTNCRCGGNGQTLCRSALLPTWGFHLGTDQPEVRCRC
jgi:hypothetical protein